MGAPPGAGEIATTSLQTGLAMTLRGRLSQFCHSERSRGIYAFICAMQPFGSKIPRCASLTRDDKGCEIATGAKRPRNDSGAPRRRPLQYGNWRLPRAQSVLAMTTGAGEIATGAKRPRNDNGAEIVMGWHR